MNMHIIVCLFMLSEVSEQEFAGEIHINSLLTKTFSIIIPAYNEEKRLKPVLTELCTFIETNNFPWNVIVSIDGNDGTEKLVKTMMMDFPFLDYIKDLERNGKGGSIKKAVNFASGEFVMLMDADGAVALEDMVKYIGLLEMFDFINFDRYRIRENHIPRIRRFVSRGYNFYIRSLFRIDIDDTQCGYKLMKTDVAKAVFGKLTISNTFFYFPFFVYLKRMGMNFVEVPVDYVHIEGSKFKVPSMILGGFISALAFRIRNSPFWKYIPKKLVDLYYRKFIWI